MVGGAPSKLFCDSLGFLRRFRVWKSPNRVSGFGRDFFLPLRVLALLRAFAP